MALLRSGSLAVALLWSSLAQASDIAPAEHHPGSVRAALSYMTFAFVLSVVISFAVALLIKLVSSGLRQRQSGER